MTKVFLFGSAAMALMLPIAAQEAAQQVAAQEFGPVAVSGGERLEVCVGNLGEAASKNTVQFFSLGSESVKVVAKFDPSLDSGKSACYHHTPKAGGQFFVVLAGDPKAGWDISDRTLVASAQVLDSAGKTRVALQPLPKIVSTKLLQK